MCVLLYADSKDIDNIVEFVRDKGKRTKQEKTSSSKTSSSGKENMRNGEVNNEDDFMRYHIKGENDSFVSEGDAMQDTSFSSAGGVDADSSFQDAHHFEVAKKIPKRRRKQLDLTVLSPHVHDLDMSNSSQLSATSEDGAKRTGRPTKTKLHRHLLEAGAPSSSSRDAAEHSGRRHSSKRATDRSKQSSSRLFGWSSSTLEGGGDFHDSYALDEEHDSDEVETPLWSHQQPAKRRGKGYDASADSSTPLDFAPSKAPKKKGAKGSNKASSMMLSSPGGCGLTPSLNNLGLSHTGAHSTAGGAGVIGGGGVSSDIMRQLGHIASSPEGMMGPGGILEGMSPFFDSPRQASALFFGGSAGSFAQQPTTPGLGLGGAVNNIARGNNE